MMKIKIHNIGSGSKGNATFISDGETNILIDLGLTRERIISGLNEINVTLDEIDYAFFTHDHSDHIKNYELIDENKRYALEGTIPLDEKHILRPYKEYKFNTFIIEPISTSHDATNPCGYILKSGDEKVVYLTDSGRIPIKTFRKMNDADIYFIESNFDEVMLFHSGRPAFLIERIYSNHGHLSNSQSATYIAKLISNKTKKIVLAHISEDCNTPEIAIATHRKIYEEYGLSLSDIELVYAKQWESLTL